MLQMEVGKRIAGQPESESCTFSQLLACMSTVICKIIEH
jgi:hypothetical protein